MKIGVDYYPEHWDKELWTKDADLMKEAGVKIVRLAEFAWSRLEPVDGEFDFTWLDEAISILTDRNIDIVLCTPTNCPPLWFYEKYPEAIQTGKDGNKIATGIRGHRCYNNPDLKRYAKRIIKKMTKHYADNSSIVAWQIDNELEANYCFCSNCIKEYHSWLKNKYGDIKAINKAYGNNVWSGEYSSWKQIIPPYGSYPKAWLNPAYTLDYNRFASDSMIQYVDMQAKIIRKNCPNALITTNTWFCENLPDMHKEFQNLDFVSYDNYPVSRIPKDSEALYSHAFHLDLMRGIKRQNFWIMEQLSGGMGCWMPMQHTPLPGMIKGYSLQAMAHGADTILHFRWRSAISGAEMFWHGLIDQSGVPGRRFEEFVELCNIANDYKDIATTKIVSDVAILYSADDECALRLQPQTDGYYYLEQLMLMHQGFTKYGVNVDIISQKEDFTNYKIVIAPEMYITDKSVVKRLYKFVKNGGSVVLTNRSGVKDEHNNCIMQQLPTVYRELIGAFVEEYDPIGNDQMAIKYNDDSLYKASKWCDIIKPESADVLAWYDVPYNSSEDHIYEYYYTGKAAITRNTYGKGTAYYIGTIGEKKLYQKLAKEMLSDCNIEHYDNIPDNVEITVRSNADKKIMFVFNNTDKSNELDIQDNHLSLKPFEMKII